MTKYVSLTIPVDPGDRVAMRRAAADLGVPYGTLTRALVLHGLDHLSDKEIQERLINEKKIDSERRRQAGRKAISQRWDKEPE